MSDSETERALAAAREQACPAVRLETVEQATISRIGGEPDLAGDLAWPERDGRPLAFLAQLDCAALRLAGAPDWLPASGLLLSFYDMIDQPWGFDPAHRGGWAVLHDPRGPAASARAVPDGTGEEDELPLETGVTAHAMESLPGPARLDGDLGDSLEDEAAEAFDERRRAPFEGKPLHQVGGWADAIQGDDMEWECALVSAGIDCGGGTPYRSHGPDYEAAAKDWRLLLQLDTDEDHGMMWGDDGRLYFWIREEDARAGAWDKAWVVLQCY